jgi:hypothetical protein
MKPPGDEDLIAYLDGELSPEKRVEMERRLAASWELQCRLADLRRDIELYMQATAREEALDLPPAETAWKALAPRLEGAPRTGRRWTRGLTAGAIAAGLACLVFLRLTSTPAVSAAEALLRAQRSEAAALHSVVHPVVHRKMRVRRFRPAAAQTQAVWEVWSAVNAARARHETAQGDGEVLRELRTTLERNGLDPDRPLSAAAYAQWRERSGPGRDRVERRALEGDGAAIVVITEPRNGAGILSAGLTLREADWRPVAQELSVRTAAGPERFEISEVESSVMALASLPPAFFDVPAMAMRTAPVPALRPMPVEPPPLSTPPAAPGVETEKLLEAALLVHNTLHRTGDCADREIAIERSAADRVDVRAMVGSAGRKAELIESLGALPLLRLDVQVGSRPDPAGPGFPRLAKMVEERMRIQESAAVSLASLLEAIQSDADALHRHARDFEARELEAAPAGPRLQYQKALREHLAALRSNLSQVAALLAPGEKTPAPEETVPRHPSRWRVELLSLIEAVSHSCSPAAAAEISRRRMADACLELSRQAALSGEEVAAALGGSAVTRPRRPRP